MNFTLLMTRICDIGDDFVMDEINHNNLGLFAIQNHKIKVIPIVIFTIKDKCSSECTYSAIMLILFSHLTSHMYLFPCMNTFSNVGFVRSILEVINQLLSAI